MENRSVGIILSLAIAILLGVILVQIIAGETVTKTSTVGAFDESHAIDVLGFPDINETAVYTLTNAPSGWKTEQCPLTSFVLTNGSDALTDTTDYIVDLSAGTYTLVDNADTNESGVYQLYDLNTTYASYYYCGNDYLAASWGRSLLNLVPGFFVLAILIGAAFVIFYILKAEGIKLD